MVCSVEKLNNTAMINNIYMLLVNPDILRFYLKLNKERKFDHRD